MSLKSRFDPPTPQEEPKPVTTCAYCDTELYYGDEVYHLWDIGSDHFYCGQCGPDAILDRYEPEHKITLDEKHI